MLQLARKQPLVFPSGNAAPKDSRYDYMPTAFQGEKEDRTRRTVISPEHASRAHSGSELMARTTAPEEDPVCGMRVTLDIPHRIEHNGVGYLFCSAECLATFRRDPARYIADSQPGDGHGRAGSATPPSLYGSAVTLLFCLQGFGGWPCSLTSCVY